MTEASIDAACHVFAFEGRGGFPTWATPGGDTRPRRRTDPQGRPIPERGRLSLSLVLDCWYDAVRAAGTAGWHYYAQSHWRRAVADIQRLADPPHDGPAIALIGFSNGGDAAYQVARAFQRRGRKIALVFTADPVRKPLRGIGLLGFRKPDNVAVWHNFYQRCDRCTLGGLLPVVGRHVDGADTNCRLDADDFPRPMNPRRAHLWVPAHPLVTQTITASLRRLGR